MMEEYDDNIPEDRLFPSMPPDMDDNGEKDDWVPIDAAPVQNNQMTDTGIEHADAFSDESADVPEELFDNESAPIFETEPFYSETIKHTQPRRGGFKRIVAVACIVSILGGGSLGIGLGIGATVAGDWLIPSIQRRSLADTAEVDFSFEEAAPAEKEEIPASASVSGIGGGSPASYADVIKKVEPSVVCITSALPPQDSFFGMEMPRSGSGSGILFHESESKYYIATNYHVVRDSDAVSVSIEGSDPVPANLVGSDSHNDIAVIYIDKTAAQAAGVERAVLAQFGDSDHMQVGDVVLAIGNALGEGNIATNGIVSAQNKSIVIQRGLSLTVLQTNAAINPGNSGGPLINLNGEVIGINTAKISETNTEGMGYSIPSNIAKPIIEDFMASVNRPYIGVQISTLTPEIANQYNLLSAGALVEGVVEGSPAERAGVQVMDIITGLNDEPVLTAEQLTDAIAKLSIGDTVELKLIRGGTRNITLRITLEQRL